MREYRGALGGALLAAVALAAAAPLSAGEEKGESRLPAEGIERIELSAKGGAALLSLCFTDARIEICGEERPDIALSVEREGGGGIPRAEVSLSKSGNAAIVTLDRGGYRLFRLGRERLRLRLRVPRFYRGDLELRLDEGKAELRDLGLGELKASLGLGSLDLERVTARAMTLRTREASSSLRGCGAEQGRIETGLGAVKAEALSGSWTLRSAEGPVSLSMARGFGPLDIETKLGRVRLELPKAAPFSLEASIGLGTRPKADMALVETVIRERCDERRVFMGKEGEGGPLVRIRTEDGGIAVSRRAD
jgi:hypothetical protein